MIRILKKTVGSCATILLLPFIAMAQNKGLQNPLDDSISSIPLLIAAILKVVVMVALPIITLFIVYSGFKFIAAQGNSAKLEEAKKNFLYVIIGAILILGAWVIATLIGGTVSQLVKGI